MVEILSSNTEARALLSLGLGRRLGPQNDELRMGPQPLISGMLNEELDIHVGRLLLVCHDHWVRPNP